MITEQHEHPADLAEGCDMKHRPTGFASIKQYISAHKRVKARGEGYGASETSQSDADSIALHNAKLNAAKALRWKLGMIGMAKAFIEKLETFLDIPRPLVNEKSNLIAPIGTFECNPRWEGRLAKKPWDYKVTVGIPHLNTPEPLKVCIDVLRAQTERPYIIVVDTGSPAEVRSELENIRAEDVEIHYIAGHGYRHSSEPVTTALDLIQARCQTRHLFQTHADCFLRRHDFLESMLSLVNEKTPIVGYRMSPRDWITEDWKWMIGHTATMFYMPIIHRNGVTWSMQRMHQEFGVPYENLGGWPDTETGFNYSLRAAGISPVFIGHDTNFERYVDGNIDHCRSHTGSSIYAPDYYANCSQWMLDAIREAKERIAKK